MASPEPKKLNSVGALSGPLPEATASAAGGKEGAAAESPVSAGIEGEWAQLEEAR